MDRFLARTFFVGSGSAAQPPLPANASNNLPPQQGRPHLSFLRWLPPTPPGAFFPTTADETTPPWRNAWKRRDYEEQISCAVRDAFTLRAKHIMFHECLTELEKQKRHNGQSPTEETFVVVARCSMAFEVVI